MITVLSPSPALDVTYLLDTVAVGEIHRPRELLRLPGGKGLNVARAAASLGGAALVIAPIGGHIGALIAELAVATGLSLDAVPVAGETRQCVSAIPSEGAATEFYEGARTLDAAEADRLTARFTSAPAAGWSVLAGQLPELPGIAEALLARRAAGDQIAIDSSGSGIGELIDTVRPDLLKVNRYEAAEIANRDPGDQLANLATVLRTRTAGMVVLTDAAAGAIGTDAVDTLRVLPDPVPGRFSIGSGDSFLAGLLVALAAGATFSVALRTASAAGSANTRVPGAAVFSRVSFDAAFARITMEAV